MKTSLEPSALNASNPLVSIVMAVYNGERFLKQAIESMVEQTFTDFELIIVNDGSTDATERIIKSFQDERIISLTNESNRGLAYSFNRGMGAACGLYVARMDADDLSVPNRLEKQVSFLKRKPHVDIVGSGIIVINEQGEVTGRHPRPMRHAEIKYASLYSTPMYHPTIMGRAAIFKNYHYNESLSNSEDYELWSRLLFETPTRFANLSEPVLYYRVFPHSFTRTLDLDKRALSAHNTIKNIERYVKLSPREKETIIRHRQEHALSLGEFVILLTVYFKATLVFVNRERPGLRETLGLSLRYSQFFLNLIKFQIKKMLNVY